MILRRLLGEVMTGMGFITRQQLDEALKEQQKMFEAYKPLESEKLGASIEIGFIVNSTLDLAEVLTLIMRHANRVTNSAASTLMLLDDKTGELVFSVPTGPKADELIDMRLAPGKGIAGWVAEHGHPLLVPNAREDPRFYPEIDKISGFETKSILCVPLKAKAKLIGVLEAINKVDGTSFTEEDELLLSVFAYQAAMAIENARLYGELKDRLEEERQLQEQLFQAHKMEAIGTLAGGIAHDFNNILMGIQGNASLMLLDKTSSHPDYERLRNIEKSVLSGAELTKQLLGFARGGRYEVKPTDLNELIERQNRMFGRTKKEITVHGKYEENLWTVEVDQGQIEQALLNLFVNAWQAMPGGGDLYIQTDNVILDEDYVKPFNMEPGRYVKTSITDTGVGMDEGTQQRIFEPFFTTKEMGRGAGLGLASVYGIIKNHGGIINVYSERGEGTTFTIHLPASEKEVIKEEKAPEEILKGEEAVLLVDDEGMVLDVGEQMLKQLGYKVLIATGGREAIGLYKKNPEKIDIVILDMIMPEMGGGKTYDSLKKINPHVKVLLSSGYSVNGQATEILERGCDGFIQKPFNMKELSQKLRDILDSG